MMNNQITAIPSQRGCTDFWQEWVQYQDYLYHCCLNWMGGNPSDAEDALSRAMLKAWEKAQKFAGKIANFKAWLTRLTENLCVDIHRERSRGANRVEDIEGIGEEKRLVSVEDIPIRALETDEKRMAIRGAIDNLPARLRETFILHFYREFSHQEIVQEQGISYQKVCKRISQARKILGEELRGYFIGEDETDRDLVTPGVTESVEEEMSQNAEVMEDGVGEVETVDDEVPQEVEESEQHCQENFELISNIGFFNLEQYKFYLTLCLRTSLDLLRRGKISRGKISRGKISEYAKLFVSLRTSAKQSQNPEIAWFHSVQVAMTNAQLILPKYLLDLWENCEELKGHPLCCGDRTRLFRVGLGELPSRAPP